MFVVIKFTPYYLEKQKASPQQLGRDLSRGATHFALTIEQKHKNLTSHKGREVIPALPPKLPYGQLYPLYRADPS